MPGSRNEIYGVRMGVRYPNLLLKCKNEKKINNQFFFFCKISTWECSTYGMSCDLSQVLGITIYNGGFRTFNNNKIKNVFQ